MQSILLPTNLCCPKLPDRGVLFDNDVDQAVATRRSVLAQTAADRIRMAGIHLDFPAVAYVEAVDDSYRRILSVMDLKVH